MRNRSQVIFGAVLIGLGVISLLSSLFNIDLWALCFPTALVLAGVWLVFRPRQFPSPGHGELLLLGDLRRRGNWQVRDSEYWVGVGDIDLDMVHADLPPGETRLRVYGFVGEIEVLLPQGVGLSVDASGVVSNLEIAGRKEENIFSPTQYTSPDYAAAERKLKIEATAFVTELKVNYISLSSEKPSTSPVGL